MRLPCRARQCGKTTLAKQLYTHREYLNYDVSEDRLILKRKNWDRNQAIVIFDELHKMKNWKRWLKGIYDTEGVTPPLLVTGSARLDVYKKMGDSLAGRFFQYRLHPLDLKEITELTTMNQLSAFDQLWHCSGFPEPFLEGDPMYYKRWRRSHLDIILRQDLIDLNSVRDIKSMETLVALLKERIASTVSYASLANDLGCDANTVKRWLIILENLYVIYRVTPYSKNHARMIRKEPKFYFYDHTYAAENHGARLENLVANALLKKLNYLEDTTGIQTALHYVRTKDGKELDFLICLDQQPKLLIEVKYKKSEPAAGFKYFRKYFPKVKQIQLVKELTRNHSYPNGLTIQALIPWLAKLEIA